MAGKSKSIVPLLFILVLATFLRLYKLNSVPPSPSLDEVSIGYNAYSILKTGADEYGTKFPLLLRAYDDWRPALYVYFVIPFIVIFGLTAFAVRLPSVLLSLLTVYLTYLLAQEIFVDKPKEDKRRIFDIPAAAALLVAISPWHIYISRLGHEVNLGLTLVVLGVYFFLKFVNCRKDNIFLLLSAVFFSISFYTYQSQKIIVPFLLIILGLTFRRQLISAKKQFLRAIIVSLLLTFPIFITSLSPEALIRFKGTSVFINNPLYEQGLHKLAKAREKGDIVGQFINNRRLITLKIFWNNYLLHFSPRWLFWGNSYESHKVPNLGLLYPWEAPLIIFGLVSLFSFSINRRVQAMLIFWLLIAPLAASVTTQAPHAMRAYTFLPVWQIFGATGAVTLFGRMRSFQSFAMVTFGGLILVSLYVFYNNYFIVFPKTQSSSFQYAAFNGIKYVIANQQNFDRIVISNQNSLYQSYMFYLFHSKFNPRLYQQLGGTLSGGYDRTHFIGKYEFRPIVWSEEKSKQKVLYMGNFSDFPDTISSIYEASNLDGNKAIKIVTNQDV